MNETVLFLLLTYALCFAFQNIVPLPRWRPLMALQACAYCTGFWAGIAAWAMLQLVQGRLPFAYGWYWAVPVVAYGLASSAWCYAVDKALHGRLPGRHV